MEKQSCPEETKRIFFYYATSSYHYSKNAYIMTFNGFISSLGGSMGLFLGFSCLDTLLHFLENGAGDRIKELVKNQSRKKKTSSTEEEELKANKMTSGFPQ